MNSTINIGVVETIKRASKAGLSGVAGISGKTLILERTNVIKLADQLGLFVVGIKPREKWQNQFIL